MSFTAKLNHIRKILGKDEHFQREKKSLFSNLLFRWLQLFLLAPRKNSLPMPIGTLSSLLEKPFPAVAFGNGLRIKYLSIFLKKPF